MLGEIFYWLLNMSIIASAIGVIVLLLRSIRALPRRFSIFLWAAPFLRLCIPLGLSSRFSLISVVSAFTSSPVAVYLPDSTVFSSLNAVRAASDYFPIRYKAELIGRLFCLAALVWLIVALAVMLAIGIIYFTTLIALKDSRRLVGRIYISEKLQSPAVYGIIRPRIILPANYSRKGLKYVLRHEAAHIRRCDNLWRLLAFFAAAVHWFNPLSWIMLKYFLADIELACDQSAIRLLSSAQRREYAGALLDCVQSGGAGAKGVFSSAFGGASVRVRIGEILSYRRLTCLAALCCGCLIIAILFILLTNAG